MRIIYSEALSESDFNFAINSTSDCESESESKSTSSVDKSWHLYFLHFAFAFF